MSDDVLGIIWWKEDGNIHYRCRGAGHKYKVFYEWVKTSSYRCTSEDWPWDYFVFDDPSDHDRMLQQFPSDVWEDK